MPSPTTTGWVRWIEDQPSTCESIATENPVSNHVRTGFVFGWNSDTDNYRAIAMNDGSPNPAADGVGGPFMKIKRANGLPCTGSMSPSDNW